MSLPRLLQICAVFGSASLLSFGGGNAIVPELQLQTVDEFGWLSGRQFADSFAIAQVTPGPSTLFVTLLGYRADGLAGAVAATAAMVLPAAVLIWVVTRLWLRTGHARWHVALEHGLAPVAVGLVAASGFIIARSVDRGLTTWAITIAAGLVLSTTKMSPLTVVAAGGGGRPGAGRTVGAGGLGLALVTDAGDGRVAVRHAHVRDVVQGRLAAAAGRGDAAVEAAAYL